MKRFPSDGSVIWQAPISSVYSIFLLKEMINISQRGRCVWVAGKMLIFYCTFNLLIRINDLQLQAACFFTTCACNDASPSSGRETNYTANRLRVKDQNDFI